MGSAVIGSGAHVAMVAIVDSAGGICKSFIKSFINGIFEVQTNPRLHTLQTRSCQKSQVSVILICRDV